MVSRHTRPSSYRICIFLLLEVLDYHLPVRLRPCFFRYRIPIILLWFLLWTQHQQSLWLWNRVSSVNADQNVHLWVTDSCARTWLATTNAWSIVKAVLSVSFHEPLSKINLSHWINRYISACTSNSAQHCCIGATAWVTQNCQAQCDAF